MSLNKDNIKADTSGLSENFIVFGKILHGQKIRVKLINVRRMSIQGLYLIFRFKKKMVNNI